MNTNPNVESFIKEFDHPLEDVMRAVRHAILADARISETIKWKSPTFMYKGNLASINPRAKAHISLMFHEGATIPGEFPHLEGDGKATRYMKFADLETVEARRDELSSAVDAWCSPKDS